MSARKVMAWYAAWMALLAAAFYRFPDQHILIWSLIGFSGVGAIIYGLVHYRPRRWLPWIWLMLGMALLCVGDTLYNVLTDLYGEVNPFPSLSDMLYLAMYPLVTLGMLGLSKAGAASRDRTVPLDAMIVTAGLGLLSWVFLISPQILNEQLTMSQRLVSVAYPLGDILLLATVGRLIAVVPFSPTVALLTAGSVGLLAADVLYGLVQLHGFWRVGGPVDLGWIIFYACWGAAGLHPSMADLTTPRVVRPREMTTFHQVLLTLFVLIPLIVLIYGVGQGRLQYPMVIVAFVVATFLLALIRLFGVINSYRGNTIRTAGIRSSNAALMSATTVDGVTWVLKRTAERLLPAGTPYRAAMVMNDGSQPDLFPPAPTTGSRMRFTRSLPPEIAGQLGDFEITLLCPLALDDRPIGDPNIGVLLISADEMSLSYLQLPMEVVASQAALAIERIMLNNEITRHNSEQYFRTLVHNTADVILIVEPDGGRVRYASPSAPTVFGTADLDGKNLSDLVDSPHHTLVADLLTLAAAEDEAVDTADWTVRRPDGSSVRTEVSCRDLRDEPTVGALVVTLRDVTDQRRMEAELTHLAYHDSLTGLANRVRFSERIAQAITRAEHDGTVVGVLFIDLDDFKVVNDTLGHEHGDELLRAVGERLAEVLRSDDIAARLGGDEFAALIEGAHDAATIDEVAGRIVASLSEPFTIDNRLVSGMASIGISTSADAGNAQDLLRQADMALYVAKGEGKGQWRRYLPELHTAIVERLELRTELDQAIADQSFTLEFQPIVELRTGITAGYEALVRWHHPTRGRLLPGEFIEVAEESGQIVSIGDQVLRKAIQEAARWRREAAADAPYVSINVSARQFRAPGFVRSVHDALTDAGLPPHQLMLEITESLLLRDDDQIWEDLTELRATGVRVAIDDFGTGYSSLSYLRHVPLDVVKIDRLFTSTIASSAQQAALVDGIVRLAHTLGLQVIAEGIERTVERDLLSRIGCRYGQGFLFARPLTSEDAMKFMTAQHVPA
ncbi:putative bifunctional diguanylate cyclase/phosphodiesterase [Catellatospora tritici]|uniref:putative bifunctional diguanylate cyclase/phosphodiesterase n=1 Tax=Catellatospora tritici TaxID=2851566 RepID=UPI001C2D60C6|nr:EAL domain-containing protein [Catellatospora tritici]MBV1855032.1 EAL domain-containing protein [Catellatospora tritici]